MKVPPRPEPIVPIVSDREWVERQRSRGHRRHSARRQKARRFVEQCGVVLLKAAAVAICGAAAMIMTQPEEAARELARIVAVVTGVLALLYFSIAQWRKER